MSIPQATLKKVALKIAKTRPDEIDCETCYQELHRFAEMVLDGEEPSTVMPLMEHHLDMCNSCGEEFDALFEALQAVEQS
jgi:predicted anti-sigma-YlaC factor YlaD